MYKNISGQELRDKVKDNPDAIIIDVRTPQECYEGMIPNAVNFDLFEPHFMQRIQELDKDKEYFMVCRSGNRSGSACGAMVQMGFSKVHNLDGGMMAWDSETVIPQ